MHWQTRRYAVLDRSKDQIIISVCCTFQRQETHKIFRTKMVEITEELAKEDK